MKKIIALFTFLAILLGANLASGSGTAQASVASDQVQNSGYSTSSLLIYGSKPGYAGEGRIIAPGGTLYESTTWEPQQMAVGPGYCVLYRVENYGYGATEIGPWLGACGGTAGVWVGLNFASYPAPSTQQITVIVDYHG